MSRARILMAAAVAVLSSSAYPIFASEPSSQAVQPTQIKINFPLYLAPDRKRRSQTDTFPATETLPGATKQRPTPDPRIQTIRVPAIITEGKAQYRSIHTPKRANLIMTEPPTPTYRTIPGQRSGTALEYSAEKDAWVTKAAPTLSPAFDSIDFDGDGSNNGGIIHIPADPHGAAGPTHVASVVNVSLRVHQKDGSGTVDYNDSLGNFFSDNKDAGDAFTSLFDPKILFDQYAGRFVIVALDLADDGAGGSTEESQILLAVSDDANPTGIWYTTFINSKLNIGGVDCWADYPGFAVDEEAVYVAANMFEFEADGGDFCEARLWILDKDGFYDNTAAIVTLYDPYTGGDFDITTQPAHMFGPGPPGVGTYLVGYNALTDGTDEAIQIVRIDDPLGTATFSSSTPFVGNVDDTSVAVPTAPQTGGPDELDSGDRRALDAVWYQDSLWVTTTVVPPSGDDSGEATTHWWEMDTSTLGSPSVANQGNISGNSIASGAYTFYGAVAVNGANQAGFGFSASAGTIHPSSFYTNRSPSDSASFTEPPGTLRTGQGYYDLSFCGTDVRWGDYTEVAVDPTDGCFWVYNKHSLSQGSGIDCTGNPDADEFGRWGTAFGRFCPTGACPSEMVLAETTINSTDNRKSAWSVNAANDVVVGGGSNVTFTTRDHARLGPGFTVQSGGTFKVTLSTSPCA